MNLEINAHPNISVHTQTLKYVELSRYIIVVIIENYNSYYYYCYCCFYDYIKKKKLKIDQAKK